MREHERRYRTSPSHDGESEQGRAPVRRRRAPKKGDKLTYDDYVKQIDQQDKLFELGDDSFGDRMQAYWTDFKRIAVRLWGSVAALTTKISKKLYTKVVSISPEPVRKQGRRVQKRVNQIVSRFGTRKVVIAGTASVFLLALGLNVVANRLFGSSDDENITITETVVATPDFEVVTPKQDETQPDGEAPVFFDPSKGVATFIDEIGGKQITISQQPLTDEMKANREKTLNEVATTLLADISVNAKYGTVHIANRPDDTGDQVAVFMTDELLVFMRTRETNIDPLSWIEYINSL